MVQRKKITFVHVFDNLERRKKIFYLLWDVTNVHVAGIIEDYVEGMEYKTLHLTMFAYNHKHEGVTQLWKEELLKVWDLYYIQKLT